jgi:V/A-type H+-transporting ATPase subunit C
MRLDAVNARIGACRSRRLGPAEVRELLARPGPEARLALLRDGPLGPDLAALPAAPPPSASAVQAALRDGLRREAAALLDRVEGARPRALLRAFLGLDEAAAVKAVLRGVSAGAPVDRTLAAAPPTPSLAEPALRRAAAAGSPVEALAGLAAEGSEIAAAAAVALPANPGPLEAAERAADQAAVARAAAACRRGGEDAALVADHLADRIDARNALTLLSLAGTRPGRPAWLDGGRRLAPAALEALAPAGPEAARGAVAAAFRAPAAALATPWGAERTLERAVRAALLREARRRPLSIAVPLAYLALRWAEVRRVAIVLRGAALGLPGDELLDLAEA